MKMLKSKLIKISILLIIMSFGTLSYAYLHKGWELKELTSKADLIVIATPKAKSQETGKIKIIEDVSPEMKVIGLKTTFEVKCIFKGQIQNDTFILEHYYYQEEPTGYRGGPLLFTFKKDEYYREYLMFLKKEKNANYAPLSGQTNPNYAIRELLFH